MKIRFYLHNKVFDSGAQSIYMEVRWAKDPTAAPGDKAEARLATGITCTARQWSTTRFRPIGDAFGTRRLNDLEELATDLLGKAEALGTHVTGAALKRALLDCVKYDGEAPPPEETAEPEPEAPRPPTIRETVAHWQAQMRGQRSATYLRHMNPVADTWDAVRPGTLITELAPSTGTGRSELVENWITYLLEDVPRRNAPGEFGLDDNTVGSYIKKLRTLLQFAGQPFAWLKDTLTYEIDVEPLDYDEVMRLYKFKMPRVQLERVRDCFVFCCFTGPRYTNLKLLQPGDVRKVQGKTMLEYTQVKARKKTKVRVALDPVAVEIWQKYKGKLPVQANTQFNALIKEAAQVAGLDRYISITRQYGPKQMTESGPLWEFITCHMARHTFATMLLDGDANLVEVKDGLGHGSLQSTQRYAKAREKTRHTSTLSAFEKLRNSHTL